MVLRRVFLSAFLGFLSLALAPGFAATRYVAADAPGPVHDGASWATAFQTVASGLSAAQDGDEVWVAKGAYPESITLPAGIGLYGGFAGTETQRSERDWAANATLLNGGGAWVVTAAPGAAGPIDGFTIRNSGGAGGGILVDGANVTIRNNLIRDNIRAGSQGGGIRCLNASPVIEGNTFINNTAPVGGAIFSNSASPRIVGNRFLHNRATSKGWPEEAGAIYNGSRQSGGLGALIAGNLFVGNRVEGAYLGNYPRGGAVVTRSGRTAGNVFTANTVGHADAVGNGGAVYADGDAEVANNVFTSNSASNGAALYVSGTVTVTNNTLVVNGGVYGALTVQGGSPRLANNLIAYNGAGVYVATGATPVLRHNNVFGNTGPAYSGITDPTGTDGNIAADPRLASVEYGDVHIQPDSPCVDAGDNAFVVEGDTDMDGQPRIQGTRVDIGADESDGTVWNVVPRIVRVRTTGDDANDGSAWDQAKRTIEGAMDALAPGGGEVWVAAGTYREGVILRSLIRLYGGFAGAETAREQRDPSRLQSVLEAPGWANAVSAHGVVHATLDGFTIRGGTNRGVSLSRSDIRIANNLIIGNASPPVYGLSPDAAGVYIESGAPEIVNNRIVDNLGAGITSLEPAEPRIDGNVLTANLWGALFTGKGTLTNNTIVRNEYRGVLVYRALPSLVIANNIVAENGFGLQVYGYETPDDLPDLRNNCVFGNLAGGYSGIPNQTGLNGNIAADPMFAGLESGNVHIQPTSPCVDAGDSSVVQPGATDMDGQPRIQGAAVDIGADESYGTLWNVAPRIVRVRSTGDDANDGSGWAGAKRTVQAALDALTLTGGEVWVAEGVYDECVTLPAHTRLYGGFGGNEAEQAQRDWAAHPTVLDGGQRASVVAIPAGSLDAVVDGFTIRNGQDVRGGGINSGARFFEIAHNTLSGNRATGKVEMRDGYEVRTTGIGGGIYAARPGIVHDNVLRDNTAKDHGAGVYLSMSLSLGSGLPVLSRFTNNTVVGNQGDIVTTGGGLTTGGLGYNAMLVANNIFAHNTGGVYGPDSVTLRNNLFHENGADYDIIPDQTGLNGNLKADPRFVDLNAGDLHIRPESPCRDAGDNSVVEPGALDIDGQPRLYGAAVDIGADEVPPTPAQVNVMNALRIGGGLETARADTAAPFDLLKAVEMARQAAGLRLE